MKCLFQIPSLNKHAAGKLPIIKKSTNHDSYHIIFLNRTLLENKIFSRQ